MKRISKLKSVFGFPVSAVLLLAACSAFAGQGTGKVTFLIINRDQQPAWVLFNVQNSSELSPMNKNFASRAGVAALPALAPTLYSPPRPN